MPSSEAKVNGFKDDHDETHESHVDDENPSGNLVPSSMVVSIPILSTSSSVQHKGGSASVLRYGTLLNFSVSVN